VRGHAGDLRGELLAASAVCERHFKLVAGKCLEEPAVANRRMRAAPRRGPWDSRAALGAGARPLRSSRWPRPPRLPQFGATTRLKVTGSDLFSAGDFPGSEGARDSVYKDPGRGVYKRLVARDNRLEGLVPYGAAAHDSPGRESWRRTRRTATCEEADLHPPVRPGSDIAL
jgi:hypothetical protein